MRHHLLAIPLLTLTSCTPHPGEHQNLKTTPVETTAQAQHSLRGGGDWKISKYQPTNKSLHGIPKRQPHLVNPPEVHLRSHKLAVSSDAYFDTHWPQLYQDILFTIDSKGIDHFTKKERSGMYWDILFHDGLNSDYITKTHGTTIRQILDLLSWPGMDETQLEPQNSAVR